MVKRPKFGRGDIILVNLDPTAGHEQKGMRPALVLSTSVFNALGLALVAPITHEQKDVAAEARHGQAPHQRAKQ